MCCKIYLDSVESSHAKSSKREENENRDVDEEIRATVQTLEGFSQLSQDVLTRHDYLE